MSQTVEILGYWNYLVQSYFLLGVGTAFPHLFFQHYTPATNRRNTVTSNCF